MPRRYGTQAGPCPRTGAVCTGGGAQIIGRQLGLPHGHDPEFRGGVYRAAMPSTAQRAVSGSQG
nr:MAG TPA: hypothetical protein [Caudoviricetes sp.]